MEYYYILNTKTISNGLIDLIKNDDNNNPNLIYLINFKKDDIFHTGLIEDLPFETFSNIAMSLLENEEN